MSAPDTNIEKQEKRHRPALLGIKGAMVFGALMLIVIIFFAVLNSGDPAPEAAGTGAVTPEISVPTADPAVPGTNATD